MLRPAIGKGKHLGNKSEAYLKPDVEKNKSSEIPVQTLVSKPSVLDEQHYMPYKCVCTNLHSCRITRYPRMGNCVFEI